jgi:tetratricopeptide (TPR) repeat protein
MAAIDDEIRTLEGLIGDPGRDPEGRGFVTLADALRRAGRPEQARELLRGGIMQHPDFASALVALAQVHGDLRELTASELAWRRVIELDPEHRFAHESLERVQAQLAEESATETSVSVDEVVLPEAGDAVDDAFPASLVETTFQSPAQGESEDDTAQAEFIERVLGEVPRRPVAPRVSRPVVTRTLAETYARQGLLDAAVDVYRTLAEAQPDNRDIVERLAQLEAELGGAPPARTIEDEVAPVAEPVPTDAPVSTAESGPTADSGDASDAASGGAEVETSSPPTIADYFSNLLSSDHQERETQ